MREIILTKGHVALVDDCDYERVASHKWCSDVVFRVDGSFCVYATKTYAIRLMHRFILLPPKGFIVDHINGNGIDNRRSNMRLCTVAENNYNSKPRTGCSSIYKGVAWRKDRLMWRAYIMINKETKHIGTFDDEKEAALAYNVAAIKLFGTFAKLNEL